MVLPFEPPDLPMLAKRLEQAPEHVSVHPLDALHAGRELASTARILEGRRFRLRDFAPLESTGRNTVVLAFSAPLEGQPLRLDLRPTFES